MAGKAWQAALWADTEAGGEGRGQLGGTAPLRPKRAHLGPPVLRLVSGPEVFEAGAGHSQGVQLHSKAECRYRSSLPNGLVVTLGPAARQPLQHLSGKRNRFCIVETDLRKGTEARTLRQADVLVEGGVGPVASGPH